MIQLENVCKKLGTFELKDVSFTLPAGYICGIAGRNGAGKTTLLHLLLGLYRPDSGQVMIFDSGYDTQEKQIHDSVGVVLNEDLMENHWSLEKNGDYYGKYYSGYQKEQLISYLKQFGLEKNRKFGKLSKGEKLKYQFAFALSCNPKLLILDEPTNDLDIRTLTILEDYLDNYDGIVITVSHDRYFSQDRWKISGNSTVLCREKLIKSSCLTGKISLPWNRKNTGQRRLSDITVISTMIQN